MRKLWQKITQFLKNNWPIITIIAVSIILRFWKLGSIPPGLHPDEAANGQDVIRMIENHQFQAIYDTNGPREALFLYVQGVFVWLGHILKIAALNFTPLSLRIAPAIIGVLTVWGIYLLGKELFNKNVGLFASAAMAVSAWHIQFSRNGFRAIMAPLALVFLFYFFTKAYRNKKLKDFILTGVFLAMGFYTYLSFRMVPLILGALLIYITITQRKFIKDNLKNILYMVLVFLLLMLPMFVHFYHVPADILGRASTSIMNPEINGGSPFGALVKNIVKTMMMFNFSGDANWRHNVATLPMLDIFTGVLFWIGLGVTLWRFKKIEYFLLIMWFGAMSLPEVLTAEGIPHALRMVGTMPVVFLWIALGLDLVFSKIKSKYIPIVGIFMILVISGAIGFSRYFIIFPNSGDAGEAYAEDMVGIANDVNAADPSRQNILIVGEYGTKTVNFITHSTNHAWTRYEARDLSGLKIDKNSRVFIQRDWIDEAKVNLQNLGYVGRFDSVKSNIDQRTIYYIFEPSI